MDTNQFLASLKDQSDLTRAALSQAMLDLKKLQQTDFNPRKAFNHIPGRRVPYWLVGSQSFTTTQNGIRGADIAMPVTQDGPFIWTHYPVVMWRVNAPAAATDFGRWRPVSNWPLPDQILATNTIDISWEIRDGGAGRIFQSESLPPAFSYPGKAHRLPFECFMPANSSLVFTPTYQDIAFGGAEAATSGLLKVMLPGFRIASM